MGPVRTIPMPTYILSDRMLRGLVARLQPFAVGDPDVRDDDGPCERAVLAVEAMRDELHARDATFGIDDGSGITHTPPGPRHDR